MKKFAPLFIVLMALVFAVACGAKPPDAELAAAKAAVADAQAAGAATNCPDKLKAAEDELAKAEAQYAAKEYDACKLTCAEVIKLAEIAKACPPPAPPPPPPPPPPVVMKPKEITPVLFDYNKYNIRPDQVAGAKAAAEDIKKLGKALTLVGHCDERGSEEYNMALGMKRAKSVEGYMKSMGVDMKLITVKSMGKTTPVDPGHNEAAWAKNRRTEFKF